MVLQARSWRALAARVRVPAPSLVSVPVPAMRPGRVRSSARWMRREALLMMSPEMEPVEPPLPTWRVPAEMWVPPV